MRVLGFRRIRVFGFRRIRVLGFRRIRVLGMEPHQPLADSRLPPRLREVQPRPHIVSHLQNVTSALHQLGVSAMQKREIKSRTDIQVGKRGR
jgi:hypothetical protein